MLKIANVWYTLSEVVQMIRQNPNTPWRPAYIHYLLKIKGSGSTTFLTYADLIMRLAGYVMGEPPAHQLAQYRGPAPTANSAMMLDPIARGAVNPLDVAAINALMTTGDVGAGITNRSAHQTDPETGKPKSGQVTVTEFYVNGPEGRRATKRTEHGKVTYYYSNSHNFNTYKYARLT